MLWLLDLLGTIVFAISGALLARRERFDIFGVMVIGAVAAVGGGTLRDVLLDLPVFWVDRPLPVLAAAGAAAVTFFVGAVVPNRWMLVADALGLGLFTAAGCMAAVRCGVTWPVAAVMAVMTGSAGGVVRDVLCGQRPLIFQREIYATAALAGALVLLAARAAGATDSAAMVAGAIVTSSVRLLAIHYDWSLPPARQ